MENVEWKMLNERYKTVPVLTLPFYFSLFRRRKGKPKGRGTEGGVKLYKNFLKPMFPLIFVSK